jgi:protein-tyrosine phosphatase
LIDLHSHILHDFDDGARTLDAAVAMARSAAEGGVTAMAATPHALSSANRGHSRYSVALIRERLEELRAALVAAAVPLEIVSGTELYGEPGMLERLRAGELLPYGASRAVLLEFPLDIARPTAEQLVFSLQLAGYRVVVAHPERYRFAQEDPGTLAALVERGALMQLTGDALLGAQGPRMARLAEQLLTRGLVQLIASDAHGPHFNRMPNLAAARDRAAELLSPAAADWLTRGVPAAILADAPLPPVPPPPPPPRKRFGWF